MMATLTTLNNEFCRLSFVFPIDHPRLRRIAEEIEARTKNQCRSFMGEEELRLFQTTVEEDNKSMQSYSIIWK